MLLSVVLVGAFGCGILIGLRNSFHSVKDGINLLVDECGYPDLYAQTIDGVETSYLSFLPDDFNKDMGIKEAEYRRTHTTTFNVGDNSYSGRLIGFNYDSIIKHHIVEGEAADKIENEVRMEYYFA
jgi:hypothetical protein